MVALLFAIFYNGQFNRDLNQNISHLGEAYIHQLLPVAQLAILRDDIRTLQGLIDASIVNHEVHALAFYNAKGQLLAYRGGKHELNDLFSPPGFTGDYIESKQINSYTMNFIAPITLPKFNLYASAQYAMPRSPIASQADEILGWLSIVIDTKSILIQRYQMYIVTIVITLLGLLISLSTHYFLSKRIYLPISHLRRSMKQILRNEFETDISTTSTGEIGTIQRGCAHLQRQYLSTVSELNQHIEVATADLQQSLELLEEKNINLSLEKKKLEEKSRQRAELIANMSHEIRTPMNGVIGFTNVLLETSLDHLQKDYVKTIQSSAQDLLGIINDILDYSKIDAGKLHLDCIPLDIRSCIDEVFALIAPMANKKGIELMSKTDALVPKAMLGDPLRIKQMISNLVSNAVKFTEQGYVLIRTHIEQESDKEYTLSLAVTDTGIGMSAEDQANLFQAFNQADTSITRRYGGSGLGLVICKQLAEHMHGRISLHSELYKGSTFSVHITLAKLASYEAEKHHPHSASHWSKACSDDHPSRDTPAALTTAPPDELENLRTQLRLARPTLLLAEDNPINRMLLNSMLGEITCLETVHDGRKAVDICHQKHFNVILLDLQMPILSGIEAARLIHQECPLNKNTPILLISANHDALSNKQLIETGIDICLKKPISEYCLLQHLLSMISHHRVEIIDWNQCVQKLSGNQTLAAEYLSCFVLELQNNRDKFMQLMQDNNVRGLEEAAHQLHGACCFCGVPTLQAHVMQLERLAQTSEHTNELQGIFTAFIDSMDAVLSEYERSYRSQ